MNKIIKRKKTITVFCLFFTLIIVLGSGIVGSEGITLETQIYGLTDSGRQVFWNINGSMFGIANKNGLSGFNEGIVYKTVNYTEPYQNLSLTGFCSLDYGWCPYPGVHSNFVGITGANGYLQIFNMSTDPWTLETNLNIDDRSHSFEWHPNQYFIISEMLDSGTNSRLRIWNCSDSNPDNWNVVRTTGRFENDMYTMFVNGEKDLLEFETSTNDITYNTNVWNISDTNPNNWAAIAGSPLVNRRAGDFSPDGNFMATTKIPYGDGVSIYWASNLTLYRSFNYGNWYSSFSPDTIETEDNLISGYIVVGNKTEITVYNISDNYSITENSTGYTSSLPTFNSNGTLLAVVQFPESPSAKIYSWDYGSQNNGNIEFISIDNEINETTIYSPTPTFNWTVVSNTIQYNLQIAIDSTFTDIVVNITDINIYNYPSNYNENLTRISFILPVANKLSSYDTYYCRVRSLNR